MSSLKSSVDYRRLEEELHDAIRDDELYKLQNDAKIRAVEQNVPTYEHFRQMVNGAHLKPLKNTDIKSKPGLLWNLSLATNTTDSLTLHAKSQETRQTDNNKTATGLNLCENFIKTWGKTDPKEKFAYLWDNRHSLREKIFHIEIPSSLLTDFITVCLQHLSTTNDVNSVIDVLTVLTTCNRFKLTISFMSKPERASCRHLFEQLLTKRQTESVETVIRSLASLYEISLN